MPVDPKPRSLSFGYYGQFVREANRSYEDSVLNPHKPFPTPPKNTAASTSEYTRFLRQETAARKRRWRRSSRQLLAWVLVCSLLPILAIILDWLFFQP